MGRPWRARAAARIQRIDRESLGRMARSEVERFRWAEVAARVEEVYHELVSQYRGVAVGAHVA